MDIFFTALGLQKAVSNTALMAKKYGVSNTTLIAKKYIALLHHGVDVAKPEILKHGRHGFKAATRPRRQANRSYTDDIHDLSSSTVLASLNLSTEPRRLQGSVEAPPEP